ncbi:hypothetical protein RHGRI_016558 [Rhododendron griersonianum]|uniref:Uncharacterized protein n=1 Tax=Rhododendron griersonianum TaxID=479676 RepID=A0AAV6JUM4_9ERIC|nr:hypothetical protein RHGRI_016558 [Rhododendron griersonianum]
MDLSTGLWIGGGFMWIGHPRLEGLSYGQVLILFPVMNDQGLNARLLTGKKLGVEMPSNKWDGTFTSDSVSDSVRLAMTSEGRETLTANTREAKFLFGDKDINEENATIHAPYHMHLYNQTIERRNQTIKGITKPLRGITFYKIGITIKGSVLLRHSMVWLRRSMVWLCLSIVWLRLLIIWLYGCIWYRSVYCNNPQMNEYYVDSFVHYFV